MVADAGLLSKDNIDQLQKNGYTFIVGGRIKNETDKVKNEILLNAKVKTDSISFEVKREDSTRLIITYSEKRSRKDAHNREKGVKKLRERLASGKLTKNIPNLY